MLKNEHWQKIGNNKTKPFGLVEPMKEVLEEWTFCSNAYSLDPQCNCTNSELARRLNESRKDSFPFN